MVSLTTPTRSSLSASRSVSSRSLAEKASRVFLAYKAATSEGRAPKGWLSMQNQSSALSRITSSIKFIIVLYGVGASGS
jgi:hypothetical protein